VGWEKGDFLGRDALTRHKAQGVARRLRGFEVLDRGIARHGYQVVSGGAVAGVVTSGTQTPFLKKAIGLAYVPASLTVGDDIDIDIRGRLSRARIVPLPFYKRPRS
jgi:aminomethyltransferase